jgi:hypothetical protein
VIILSPIAAVSRVEGGVKEVLEMIDEHAKRCDSTEAVKPGCWMNWFRLGISVKETGLEHA